MKYIFILFILSFNLFANPRQRAAKRAQLAIEREKYNQENYDTSSVPSSDYVREKRKERNKIIRDNFIEQNCHGEKEFINGNCLAKCSEGTVRSNLDCIPGCIEGFELFQGRCLQPCSDLRVRDFSGVCKCPDTMYWDGEKCSPETIGNNLECTDDEIFSGVKCLKKISCRFGFDFIDGGNTIICSCPKGSYFSSDKKKCLCSSDNQLPSIKGQCKVNYCKSNKVYEGKANCECSDETKKFVSKKVKGRFLCRPLCIIDKKYSKEKERSCACPTDSIKEESEDKSFKCLKIQKNTKKAK